MTNNDYDDDDDEWRNQESKLPLRGKVNKKPESCAMRIRQVLGYLLSPAAVKSIRHKHKI